MHIEVERKFPLTDPEAFIANVQSLGGEFSEAEEQIDRYLTHPARDFAQTDEAFRMRSIGERHLVTYKGPKLDAETKTRREIELPISGQAEFAALFSALGFGEAAIVRKQRRHATLKASGWEIGIDLDHVDRIGDFAELEITTTENQIEPAKTALQELAHSLGLADDIRESYLELLARSR